MRKYTTGIVRNVTTVALTYAGQLIKSGRRPEVMKVLDWAEDFEKSTALGPAFTDQIQELRGAARGGTG